MTNALLVVDVQNDFCEGGALAVAGGNEVASRVSDWILNHGEKHYTDYYFTRDWHLDWPDTNGGHFSEEPDFKDTWPVHCVQNTDGAKLHPYILTTINEITNEHVRVFSKGAGRPDYSAFQGLENGISILEAMRKDGIDHLDICGIAGDFCVKETAADAKDLGLSYTILPAMIASVGGAEATGQLIKDHG